MAVPATVYRPRYPQATDYYRCIEDHLESFIQGYEERFERTYGFFRPYLQKVVYQYLDCGNLRNGFARVKCRDCNHEYLLAFSCKRRHFCPSCHQKRVVEFGEWLCTNVLKKIPHRHFVFSIPKILRRYFLYDRRLLHDLRRCAWESLKVFLQEVVHEKNPIPGAVIAVQTFGDLLGFNPHCHILITDGCFYGKGMFRVAPPLELKKLEAIFRHKVFRMLIARRKITPEMITLLSGWRHSGFHVFCGKRITPKEETALEHLARYIIRASFSQERMQYLAEKGTVIYSAKDGKDRKAFDATEWLAAMCSHVPNPGEQMVRYYGWYSNVSRRKRRKSTVEDPVPNIIESDKAPAACRKSWARLIRKIYEVDPLTCPICRGTMRIVSTIEDQEVIKSILNHLGLRIAGSRPRAKAHAPPVREYVADGSCSTGIPDNTFYGDPCYPWDAYITA